MGQAHRGERVSCLRRFAGVVFRPAKTFRSLADRPVWVDALVVVLAAGAVTSYLVFPFVRQDRLRTFENSASGFIEKHGQQQYADAVARLESGSRALDAFVVRPLVSLTFFLFTSLIALGAGRALTRRGHYVQVLSVFLHAVLIAALLGNAVRLALLRSRGSAIQTSTSLAAFFPELPAGSAAGAALSQVDFFALWMYGLFGLGLASVFKFSIGKGLAISSALWFLGALAGFAFAVVGKGFFL
jgi:hypothetical protein